MIWKRSKQKGCQSVNKDDNRFADKELRSGCLSVPVNDIRLTPTRIACDHAKNVGLRSFAMALFSETERPVAEALAHLIHTNPFLPDWVTAERVILGDVFEQSPNVYSRQAHWPEGHLHLNVVKVYERVQELTAT